MLHPSLLRTLCCAFSVLILFQQPTEGKKTKNIIKKKHARQTSNQSHKHSAGTKKPVALPTPTQLLSAVPWCIFEGDASNNQWYAVAKGNLTLGHIKFIGASALKAKSISYQKMSKDVLTILELTLKPGFYPFLHSANKGNVTLSLGQRPIVPIEEPSIELSNQQFSFKKTPKMQALKLRLPAFDTSLLLFMTPFPLRPKNMSKVEDQDKATILTSNQGIVFALKTNHQTKVVNGKIELIPEIIEKDTAKTKKSEAHTNDNYAGKDHGSTEGGSGNQLEQIYTLLQKTMPRYQKIIDYLSLGQAEESLGEIKVIREGQDEVFLRYYRALAHLCRQHFGDANKELAHLNSTVEIELLRKIARMQELERGQQVIQLEPLKLVHLRVLAQYPKALRFRFFPWIAEILYRNKQYLLLNELLNSQNMDPKHLSNQAYFDLYKRLLALHQGKSGESQQIFERLTQQKPADAYPSIIRFRASIELSKMTIVDPEKLSKAFDELRDRQKGNIFEWDLLNELTQLYILIDKPHLAIVIYNELLGRFPSLSDQEKFKEKANSAFIQVFEKKTLPQDSIHEIAFYYQFHHLLKDEGRHLSILEKVVQNLGDLGLIADAAELFDTVLARYPHIVSPSQLLQLGKLHLKANHPKQSLGVVERLEKHIEHDESFKELMKEIGLLKAEVFFALNQEAQAVSILNSLGSYEGIYRLAQHYFDQEEYKKSAASWAMVLQKIDRRPLGDELAKHNIQKIEAIFKLGLSYRFCNDEIGLLSLSLGQEKFMKDQGAVGEVFHFLTSPEPLSIQNYNEIEEKIKSVSQLIPNIKKLFKKSSKMSEAAQN